MDESSSIRLIDGIPMMPLETEVLSYHGRLVTAFRRDDNGAYVIEMDVRRAPWRQTLGLARGTKVHWADVRTLDIKELSVIRRRIIYRLTYGDGWYTDRSGKRRYFPLQEHLKGIDLNRACTTLALRASVLLAVMGGVGLRGVCWLMQFLFNMELSKSSLDRWVKEVAAQLPDAAGMAKQLHADKPITEANFDEIFAIGQRPKRCTLILRDEYGRIFAAREVQERTEEMVGKFLSEVKSWGITPRVFYVDGCEAYRNAIRAVFPAAVIQYDYFHVIQNIWKKLWKVVVDRRKEIKAQGSEAEPESATAQQLLGLAQRIWEHRWLFLKRDEHITEEDRAELITLTEADSSLAKVRAFAVAVWALFEENESLSAAREALEALNARPEVIAGSAFKKVVTFLKSRFDDMVAFMSHPHVRRNSLAETGIRCLRRLERGHDGFRGATGLDCYLRLYQAIKYCGWTVHRLSPGIGLPHSVGEPRLPSTATG